MKHIVLLLQDIDSVAIKHDVNPCLETIPGIGAKRRRELLRYFGGIQGIAHASLDELTKVPGISRSLAERIFAALHDTTV